MVEMSPARFVLRCYGHRTRKGNWYGACLELNLATEADSLEELRAELNDIIVSYVESVFETEDQDSIPELLTRKAPFRDRLKFQLVRFLSTAINFPNNLTQFKIVPFKPELAH